MKKFFGITRPYLFEIFDITTLLTILNVLCIINGWYWAPLFGIANCIIFLFLNMRTHTHINTYVTQFALLILNLYFLKG